jgi:hypothetical protein
VRRRYGREADCLFLSLFARAVHSEDERGVGGVEAMNRVEMLEAALWYWIDKYITDNDDPGLTDPFWFLKDKPFYPILQERLKALAP